MSSKIKPSFFLGYLWRFFLFQNILYVTPAKFAASPGNSLFTAAETTFNRNRYLAIFGAFTIVVSVLNSGTT